MDVIVVTDGTEVAVVAVPFILFLFFVIFLQFFFGGHWRARCPLRGTLGEAKECSKRRMQALNYSVTSQFCNVCLIYGDAQV